MSAGSTPSAVSSASAAASPSANGAMNPGWSNAWRTRSMTTSPPRPVSCQRPRQVLAVLAAARVGRVHARGQGQDPAMAGRVEPLERRGEQRLPVAVAPLDREVDVAPAELVAEGRQQGPVLGVDRAHPAEGEVVVRDLLEALAGYAPTAGHVLEERHHVVGALGAAERDQEQGVDAAPAHRRTSSASSQVIRRPVWNGISSRTWRRASVARRSRMRSTSSWRSSASRARIHS